MLGIVLHTEIVLPARSYEKLAADTTLLPKQKVRYLRPLFLEEHEGLMTSEVYRLTDLKIVFLFQLKKIKYMNAEFKDLRSFLTQEEPLVSHPS